MNPDNQNSRENNEAFINELVEYYFKSENIFSENKKKHLINCLEKRLKTYPQADLELVEESTWDEIFQDILPTFLVNNALSEGNFDQADSIEKNFQAMPTFEIISSFFTNLNKIIIDGKMEKSDIPLATTSEYAILIDAIHAN